MTFEEELTEKLRTLTPEQKQEVLEFVEFLYRKYVSERSPKTEHPTLNTAREEEKTA